MLKLRVYDPKDAENIVSWCKDELTFRRWTSDRYDHFPITAEDINHKYIDCNGDCPVPGTFFPFTAYDDEFGVAGHLIMRFTDEEKKTLRFGFVIVDDKRRGTGCGKAMLRLALHEAFDVMNVEKVTIGVFENNPGAYYCYKSVGFKDNTDAEPSFLDVFGERWKCVELELTADDYSKLA